MRIKGYFLPNRSLLIFIRDNVQVVLKLHALFYIGIYFCGTLSWKTTYGLRSNNLISFLEVHRRRVISYLLCAWFKLKKVLIINDFCIRWWLAISYDSILAGQGIPKRKFQFEVHWEDMVATKVYCWGNHYLYDENNEDKRVTYHQIEKNFVFFGLG